MTAHEVTDNLIAEAAEALKHDSDFIEQVSSDLLDSWAEHVARTVLGAVLAARPSGATEDVAALVAELRHWVAEPQPTRGEAVPAREFANLARRALAALEVSSRTVAPNREAFIAAIREANKGAFRVPDFAEWMADTLLADADLWQPAPAGPVCAWCDNPATGTAESPSDGQRYPSCGCAGVADTFAPYAVQPVTPDRETLAKAIYEVTEPLAGMLSWETRTATREWYLDKADALLASGVLGQPQPQPDRAEIKAALVRHFHGTEDDVEFTTGHDISPEFCDEEDRLADALLPLLGQPRTDVIAETIREFEDLYFGPGVQTRTWVANAMRQRHGLPPRTDAPLDPEPWEDGHRYTEQDGSTYTVNVSPAEFAQHRPDGHRADGSPYWNYEQVHRRKAGPWVPVEQDQARYPRTDTTEPGDSQ